MPAVHLLRHGQAKFGATDYDSLSEVGERHAEVVGAILSARTKEVPRWNEFAMEIIRTGAAPAPTVSARTAPTEFQIQLDAALGTWIAFDPAGWKNFKARGLAALQELSASVPSGRAAVVATSSGVVAAICAELINSDHRTFVALSRVSINASMTTIAASSRAFSRVTFTDHSHLLS